MKILLLFTMFIFIACLDVEVPIDIKVSSNLIPQEAAINYLNSGMEKTIIRIEKEKHDLDYTWLPIFNRKGMVGYGVKEEELVHYSDLSFQVMKWRNNSYYITITHKNSNFNRRSSGPGPSYGWAYSYYDDDKSFSVIEKSANAMIALGMKYEPAKGQ